MSRGDPRGELIRLQLQRDHSTGTERAQFTQLERAHFAKHREALLGRAGVLGTLNATWRRGYIDSVVSPPATALSVLLTHPSGVMLNAVTLDNPHLQLDAQLETLGRSRHRRLSRITVRADDDDTRFEATVPVFEALGLPALVELEAHVHLAALRGHGGVSQLRRLTLSARTLELSALTHWSWPRLESLDLAQVLHQSARGWWGAVINVALARAELSLPPEYLSASFMPALREVCFRNFVVTLDSAAALMSFASTHAALNSVDLTDCKCDPDVRHALHRLAVATLKLPAEPTGVPP